MPQKDKPVRVAMIGLDTSHAVEFTRRFQDPACPPELQVPGGRVTRCLRFPTPFLTPAEMDGYQKQVEGWGVEVTESFDTAVADADAVMIEINDPALHGQYFERCAGLGLPVFVDKPLADTTTAGRRILELAQQHGTRAGSSSSLRFVPALAAARAAVAAPHSGHTYGPVGDAKAGSSIVWYGVHAVEMLQRSMGAGARTVTTVSDDRGVILAVRYEDGRRGVVELTRKCSLFGGTLRNDDVSAPFTVSMRVAYSDQLTAVLRFFRGGESPGTVQDALQILSILDAGERSLQSGRQEVV